MSSAPALLGVLLGGAITARVQARGRAADISFALRGERRDALAAFLSAIRTYRRFLMYADLQFEIVPPTEHSKGTILVDGRAKFDAAVDEAFARLLIVIPTEEMIEQASSLSNRVNAFIKARDEYGKGNIPNEIVRGFSDAEREFAERARLELKDRNTR